MDITATIGAGILSGLVMAAVLYMGIGIMPSQMKMNLFNLLGTMMFRDKVMVYVAGAMIHMVMSVAFAFAHVGIYQAFDIESSLALWGLVFGFGHFVFSGMAMGMMPMGHPGVRAGVVQAPGLFATAYPPATVMGFHASPALRRAGGSVLRRLRRGVAGGAKPPAPTAGNG